MGKIVPRFPLRFKSMFWDSQQPETASNEFSRFGGIFLSNPRQGMPVCAVALNNQVFRGDEEIHDTYSRNAILRDVIYSEHMKKRTDTALEPTYFWLASDVGRGTTRERAVLSFAIEDFFLRLSNNLLAEFANCLYICIRSFKTFVFALSGAKLAASYVFVYPRRYAENSTTEKAFSFFTTTPHWIVASLCGDAVTLLRTEYSSKAKLSQSTSFDYEQFATRSTRAICFSAAVFPGAISGFGCSGRFNFEGLQARSARYFHPGVKAWHL